MAEPTDAMNLIPEIYYDLIARVMPGTAMVLCLSGLRDGLFLYHDKIGWVGTLAVLLGSGYIAGLLLSVPTFLLSYLLWTEGLRDWLYKKAGCEHLKSQNLCGCFRDLYKEIDKQKKRDPVAGSVLLKMEAIASLAENLLSTVVVLGAVSVFSPRSCPMSLNLLSVLFLSLLIAVVLRRGVLLARLKTLAV